MKIFFVVFLVAGMRKKNDVGKKEKKKKGVARAGLGYYPIPKLGHDTTDCIVT